MIQAAINPETKEFLGLIIPKEDLNGDSITIQGSGEDWAAATRGEPVDPSRIAIFRASSLPDCKVTVSVGDQPAPVEVEGLAKPEPELYYIRDTRQVVGNSAFWWCVDGHGYTCNLAEAWQIPEAKAREICRSRKTDVAYPAKAINKLVQLHIDVQLLGEVEALEIPPGGKTGVTP